MNFDKQSVTALIFSWYHVNDGKISSIRVTFDPRSFTQKRRQIIKKIKNDLFHRICVYIIWIKHDKNYRLKILVKEYSINYYNSNVSITSSNLSIASFSLF